MPWQQLTVTTHKHLATQFEQLLEDFGTMSITFSDGANQPIYEPPLETTPLWEQVRVTGLFEAEHDPSNIQSYLENQVGETNRWQLNNSLLQDQVWERVWLKDFQPIKFGRNFWVCSSEHEVLEENAILLQLDPGLAFGTGTHPTTAL